MMPESPETQQIQIVVQGPDEKSDTCSTTSVRSALRRTASAERMKLDPALAPSISSACLGKFYPEPPPEGTTTGIISSLSGGPSRTSSKSVDLEHAEPISPWEVKRYDRERFIPKPKKRMDVMIGPGQKDFDDSPRYDDWAPHVHPDGALYFFDSKRRIYTDADLSDGYERQKINYYAERLCQQASETPGFSWASCELVLETSATGCGYYFVEPGTRCILWLTPVSSTQITRDLERVQSFSHIKYAMETEYWMHCMLFPNNWSVTTEVIVELKHMILHAVAESITSTTSVIPLDQEQLAKMLDLTDRLKDAIEEPFPHAKCIVAQFMHNFATFNFFNFCGQPGARLNYDQSIFRKGKPRRSMLINILSFFLFWAPCDYANELDNIWVDGMITPTIWKQFIAKWSNDWSSLALYATVMLNTNVAFLALGDDMVAKSFSFVSTVTSIAVVVLGLILIRQNQRKDLEPVEQVSVFLGEMSHPVSGTEVLAVIFGLPYALLMWSMVFFVVAFACMVFRSAGPITNGTFGAAGGLVCVFIFCTVLITRAPEKFSLG
ncbi:hypothetical protein M405DRAFT_933568 [Rhizopogon salebrosus TDB-379]|nr:hypothetical protein M405DRAFT_933568 [Rhizopogon salebrosus TDB-379]